MKKILIISDNHGFVHQLRAVIEKEQPIDLFLHLGDGERSKSEYERMLPPLTASIYLKGNNDFLPLQHTARFLLEGVEIFAAHGDKYGVKRDFSVLETEAKKQGAKLVCYGHTHRALIHKSAGITYVNPGSLSGYYSPTGSTYAIAELEAGKITGLSIRKVEM